MRAQHFIGPWYVDMDPIDIATDIRVKWGWNGKETIPNQLIAQMCGKRDDTRDANAEFIVRACNAHDDLLNACKQAKAFLSPRASQLGEAAKYVLHLAETAIEKASS